MRRQRAAWAAGLVVLVGLAGSGCRGTAAPTLARPTVVLGPVGQQVAVDAADERRYARGVAALGQAYARAGEYLQGFLQRETQAFALGHVSAADHATMRTEIKYLALAARSYLDTLKYTLDTGGAVAGPPFDAWAAERLFADFALRVTAQHPTLHTELTMLAERVRGAFFVIAVVPWEPRPEGVAVVAVAPAARAGLDAATEGATR